MCWYQAQWSPWCTASWCNSETNLLFTLTGTFLKGFRRTVCMHHQRGRKNNTWHSDECVGPDEQKRVKNPNQEHQDGQLEKWVLSLQKSNVYDGIWFYFKQPQRKCLDFFIFLNLTWISMHVHWQKNKRGTKLVKQGRNWKASVETNLVWFASSIWKQKMFPVNISQWVSDYGGSPQRGHKSGA